jgi:beta-1,4-mannooligosaccharide/beta-1,4-mannosyl-N-acetylglucosamine phosphorylase
MARKTTSTLPSATQRKRTIIGPDLPRIPWEDKPRASNEVVWRSRRNPIIPRDAIPAANSIFNSAVVPFGNAFAGVFRIDDRRRRQQLHAGFSRDGIRWKIDEEPIQFVNDSVCAGPFEYGYDPRVCWIEDRYYVTWCNGFEGQPTIGIAWTENFRDFHQLDNAFLPFNRNGVLFPRKISGNYAMLNRPSDPGHTPFGDIFYSESPDLTYWGLHRLVMRTAPGWQRTKIGAGPIPIETTEGWLMIYHGVLTSCNGFTYSMGAALLDLEQPWKVLYRTRSYILAPWAPYECVGDVPNVAFPCAALADAATGRLAIYYGGADTVTCLAFAQVDELIHFIRSDSR